VPQVIRAAVGRAPTPRKPLDATWYAAVKLPDPHHIVSSAFPFKR